MAKILCPLLSVTLLAAACSTMAAAPTTTIPPAPSVPGGPPDTAAAAAPTEAKFACRELDAAANLLLSGTGSAQAASMSKTGVLFAKAAAAHDPPYVTLSHDARRLATFAARRTLLLLLSGGELGDHKPANLAPMRAIEADCS